MKTKKEVHEAMDSAWWKVPRRKRNRMITQKNDHRSIDRWSYRFYDKMRRDGTATNENFKWTSNWRTPVGSFTKPD